MNAAAGSWFADGILVCRAVDVNVARVRIHVDAAIESFVQAGFETFEPQDARGDFGVRQFRLRRVANGFARFENRSSPFARADFFCDAMQSERRALRTFRLPDAETRSGAGDFFYEFVLLKKRNGLPGDADDENKLCHRNAIFLASGNKIQWQFHFNL